LQFPLQFPSLQEEINLLALKELLMVGEGGWWLLLCGVMCVVDDRWVVLCCVVLCVGGRDVW
jgi:hypothetical protein